MTIMPCWRVRQICVCGIATLRLLSFAFDQRPAPVAERPKGRNDVCERIGSDMEIIIEIANFRIWTRLPDPLKTKGIRSIKEAILIRLGSDLT